MTDTKYDGRYFAWVRNVTPWVEPKLYPQLIIDTEVAKYLINHQNKSVQMDIIKSWVLPIEDYKLTIDALMKKYPAPEM